MAQAMFENKQQIRAKSNCSEYSALFQWFDSAFSAVIKQVSSEFWEYAPDVKLFSVEKNSVCFIRQNDFFVTQAQSELVSYSARLSETFCNLYFLSVLGGKTTQGKKFSFQTMTEFESRLLCKYNDKLLKTLKELLISKNEIVDMVNRGVLFTDILQLTFVIYDKSKPQLQAGKMLLSIPVKLIKIPQITLLDEEKVDILQFKKAETFVDIKIGSTRLSLDEINNLEEEDIVVLDDSNLKKMTVISPCEINFRLAPDPRLIIKADNDDDDEFEEGEEVSNPNIWDNIQVDVNAKFNSIKMSLGELRQMTEGVVLELDYIYENDVVLEVENRNVAKGELVILGDKYGIKINEIFEYKPEVVPQPKQIAETEEEEEYLENEEPQEENEEDFDVSDFDIDESDL